MVIGDYIFVYGTLRKGEGASAYMKDCEYIGEDKITGAIYTLGGFPGLKIANTDFFPELPSVTGDVFRIGGDNTISRLDGYEGYPSLYSRMVVKTESGLSVWVYTYNGRVDHRALVESGNWKDRRAYA